MEGAGEEGTVSTVKIVECIVAVLGNSYSHIQVIRLNSTSTGIASSTFKRISSS